jgi:ankyrin repeat protein
LNKESNTVLQSFTSGSNKWSGTCTFFSLWYAFKRLLEPDKNSRQIYLEINTFLKINKNNIDNFMQEIISTFFSFLNIDLDNFTLKKRNFDKVSLLRRGIENKNLDAINFILSKEKDYDKLLIETVYYNSTPVVELLLERGANVNSKDNTYSTALMIASHENNSDTVRVLIDHGANINQKNIFGKTALDYASDNNYTEIIDLLLKNGAKPKVTWWDWIFSNKKPYNDEAEKDAKTIQNEEWDERWNSLGGKQKQKIKTKQNKSKKTKKNKTKKNKTKKRRKINRKKK